LTYHSHSLSAQRPHHFLRQHLFACDADTVAAVAAHLPARSPANSPQPQERLHELMQESMLLGGLVVIHNPNLMLEMCSINLATHETCVPPLGHFVRVAERLGLVQEQVLQMRLMLRQYNRSMQQQLQQGLRLLEVSQDSASLQVKAGAAAAQQPMHSGSGRSGGTGGQAAGGTSAGAATAAAAASNGGSTQQRGSSSCLGREGSAGGAGNGGLAAAPAASGGGGGGEASGGDPSNGSSRQQQQQDLEEGAGDELGMEGLFKELEQHLGDRLKVMQVSIGWCRCDAVSWMASCWCGCGCGCGCECDFVAVGVEQAQVSALCSLVLLNR
jgi:hypothetical protein